MIGEILLPSFTFTPLVMFACAVAMVVLRAGASRVFFDIVGTFQATKLIQDTKAAATVFEALYMDAIMGIQEAAQEIATPFNELMDAVIPVTREIEEARIEMEKFLDVTGEAARAVQDDISRIGIEYGFAADEAFMASARMAQLSGVLGQGTVSAGTRLGMEFGLISGMETEAAMQRMINLQQQTKFMTEGLEDNMEAEERAQAIRQNSIRVLDQLNTVENRSAATMQQITFVMNQFASQAHLTNESIAAMAAMSATLIEAGEEQGKGGRALRMIYARLGANTNGAADAVTALGISLKDAEGNMRPFSQILVELAERYETMNGAEQQALAQSVAGNRHYTRLIKLLENVDRVRELEFEAILAQFPAMDEIERRRDTELFQLNEAEARLKTYSGVLGESLLPALTKVTNQQALYTRDLAALSQSGFFGPIIGGIMGTAQAFQKFVGPVFNMLISLKNVQISMQTYQAITRALNNEQLAGAQAQANVNGVMIEATPIANAYTAALNELKNAREMEAFENYEQHILSEQEIADMEAEEQAIRDRIAANNDLIISLQGVQYHEGKRAGSVRGGLTTQNLMMEDKLKETIARNDERRARDMTGRAIQRNVENETNKETAMAMARQYNQLQYELVAAGMALTIFGKSEKAQRMGMLLNIAAMGVQIYKTIAMTIAKQEDTKAQLANNVATNSGAKANTLFGNTALFTAKNVNKATAAVSLLTKRLIIYAGLAYGIVTLIEKIGWLNLDAAEAQEEYNTAVADSGAVASYMQEYDTAALLNDELERKKTLLGQIEQSQDTLTQTTIEGLQQEIVNLRQARDIREFTELGLANDDEVNRYFDLLQQEKDILRDFGEGPTADPFDISYRMLDIPNQMMGKGYQDRLNKIRTEIGYFHEDFEMLANYIERHGITNIDDLRVSMELFGEEIEKFSQKEKDALQTLVGGMDEAKQAVHEFANEREELFYGFAASNVTGDLVKQVKQQGVETLITTTEVIMTNIFNGMTIPEMADILIDELERRGFDYSNSLTS
jgi:TP901 family phage tail tape measure protein